MRDITTVLEIISSVSSPLTLDEIVAHFAEKTTQLVGADGCHIFRLQPKGDTMVMLGDFVSPEVVTPFGNVSHAGAIYPLGHYPTTARVLRQQIPLVVYVDDPTEAEEEKNLLNVFQWAGVLMLPMICRGETIGLLNLYTADKQGHQFSDDDVTLCQTLANQIAVAIENARLYEEAEEGQLVAEAMQVIGRALASELDYQRIVRNVADFAYRLVNPQCVYVAVPEDETFRLVAITGHDNLELSGLAVTDISAHLFEHTYLTQAVQEKRPVVVADIKDDSPVDNLDNSEQGWRAMVAVPLLAHNNLVGVLAAYTQQPDFFGSNEVGTLMSLASQAAVAIHNAQLFAEIEAQRQALQRVSLRLVSAQEEERRRISRELHDELGQALTALKINLDVARRSIPADAAKLNQSVHEASSLAVQTLETARNLSLELHPAILDDLGLVAALRWEIDRFEQRTGQRVHFKADLNDSPLRAELEITIYRIITEALTNVARHAQAKTISVDLQVENRQVTLQVEDDGVGFDAAGWFSSPTERQSLGLVGMRERAELLGGQLEVISKPGRGTKIWVQLPLAD